MDGAPSGDWIHPGGGAALAEALLPPPAAYGSGAVRVGVDTAAVVDANSAAAAAIWAAAHAAPAAALAYAAAWSRILDS